MFTFELIITFDDNISDPLRGTEILSPKNALRSPLCGYAPLPAPAAKAAPSVPPKGGSPKYAL